MEFAKRESTFPPLSPRKFSDRAIKCLGRVTSRVERQLRFSGFVIRRRRKTLASKINRELSYSHALFIVASTAPLPSPRTITTNFQYVISYYQIFRYAISHHWIPACAGH